MKRVKQKRRVRLKAIKYAFQTTPIVLRYYSRDGPVLSHLCAIGSEIPEEYDDCFVNEVVPGTTFAANADIVVLFVNISEI